jgi:hypothetical protein
VKLHELLVLGSKWKRVVLSTFHRVAPGVELTAVNGQEGDSEDTNFERCGKDKNPASIANKTNTRDNNFLLTFKSLQDDETKIMK